MGRKEPKQTKFMAEMRFQSNHLCHLTFLLLFLFDLILYVPSTIFQLYRDGSSWVEPVLS